MNEKYVDVEMEAIDETQIHAWIHKDGYLEMNIKAKNKEEFRDLCSFMNELFEKY